MRTEDIQVYAGTITGDGNSYSTPIDVGGAMEAVLFLDVTDVSDGKVTVSIMIQDTISGKWLELDAFDKSENAGIVMLPITSGLGSTIACSWVVEGSTNITLALNASIKA